MIKGFRDLHDDHLSERYGKEADVETPVPSDEARLLTEIRDLLAEQPRA
jgi:large-conductance mechanosensitive channel